MSPVWGVFGAQPPPLPWSARQAQMWSMIVLALLTTRLVVAEPGPAPPIRKNTSWIVVGLPAWLAFEPAGPTCTSTGELTVPASNRMPASLEPATAATLIAAAPL